MTKFIKRVFIFILVIASLSSCSIFRNNSSSNKNEDPRIKDFNFNFHFLEANKQKILGNYDAALSHYYSALEIDESQAAVCFEIAGILNLGQDYVAAMKYAEMCVDLDKTENEYYKLLLAYVYQNNNMYSQSADVYSSLVKQYPNQIHYYFELANLYMVDEDIKKAVGVLNDAENVFGINDLVSLEKERYYHIVKDYDKAAEEIEKLVYEFPENARYKTLLAESYVNAGRISDAKAQYLEIEKMKIEDGIVYFSMADFFRSQKEFDKTFKFLAEGFVREDVSIDIKVKMMISMLEIMGNDNYLIGNVKYLLVVLTEKYPDDLKIRAINSDFMLFTGDYESAQKEFDHILSIDKDKYQIWEQALYVDYMLSDMETMYSRSKEAVSLYPNVIEMYRYYVISAYFTENYTDVIDAVSYSSQIITSNQELLLEFLSLQGDAFHKLNKHHESDSVYELVLDKDAQYISVLNNYSYFLAIRGDKLERALELSTILIDVVPNNSAYIDTHSWVLFKNKKYELALDFNNKAIEIHKDNIVYFDHKGDILFMLGNKDEALKMWKKAVELGGTSEMLLKKIETKNIDNK